MSLLERPRAILAAVLLSTAGAATAERANPLVLTTPSGQVVENCADPTVLRSETPGDDAWYLYCTKDALGDWDKTGGAYVFHLVPTFRSTDLVHWLYQGDAFPSPPSWAEAGTNLWAPEIRHFDGTYFLYYAVTDTKASISGEFLCGDDSAIGVATAPSPAGPWTHASNPVVRPRRRGAGCNFYLTIDPDVIADPSGQKWIYYGNFNGGIEVRRLSADGLSSSAASAVQVVRPDIGEAPEIVLRGGLYHLFFSSSSCCSGPMSGYTMFSGRSASPTGPFLDRDGISLTATRAGGSSVLAATGNRWIGPGHNTVATDLAGQDWTIYHAIDDADPYFEGAVGYTRRPAMIDPLDWIDGWPTVRGGWWVSDCTQPSPDGTPSYVPSVRAEDVPGTLLPEASDEFDGPSLGPQWSWIRQPAAGSFAVSNGQFRFDTQNGDLYGSQNNVGVLVADAPSGDLLVEARVRHTVPDDGSARNYTQVGLAFYGGDDDYVKLVHVAIESSRQTEFAKEESQVPSGYPFYGGARIGPPADWTWLRIVRRLVWAGETYTGYTSRDGLSWVRGATWRQSLGEGAKIALVAMSGAGWSGYFDHVRTFTLAPGGCADPCDDDGDGLGDACDGDDDGDLVPDLVDCAANDPASGRPPDVPGLAVNGGAAATISWDLVPTADRYDVVRGALASLASGEYGACFADDVLGTSVPDGDVPGAGEGVSYLVRGVDSGCGGTGTWGGDGAGVERAIDVCP